MVYAFTNMWRRANAGLYRGSVKCLWLGEMSIFCCPAWVLRSKIYKPFPGSLYFIASLPSHMALEKLTHDTSAGDGEDRNPIALGVRQK